MSRKMLFAVLVVVLSLLTVTPGLAAERSVWHVPDDFTTIQDAIDSPDVADGDRIIVAGPGTYAGALVTKSVEIRGEPGATINTGPMHPAGLSQGFRLMAGSDGATIRGLVFTADLAIMNGDGVDNVTVSHNEFFNAIQAISNWRGDGWTISHNTITDLRTRCGGGIGILVADYSGGIVQNNQVSHNQISGTLNVPDDDCGGYSGTGIVLYADFRWGQPGATDIRYNTVDHNTVSLVSSNAELVDVWAFELTQAYGDNAPPVPDIVIYDNAIGFNDWRGTDQQMLISPDELEDANDISRNLGDNRGHGAHPGAFH